MTAESLTACRPRTTDPAATDFKGRAERTRAVRRRSSSMRDGVLLSCVQGAEGREG